MEYKENSKSCQLPIIDFELGAKLLGSPNTQSAKLMIAQLVKILPANLEKVKAAFNEKDNEKLKNIAPYIKGGVSFCGTPRLKNAATALDDSITANSDSAVIESAYKKLCQEIEALLSEYSKIQKKE